MILHFRRKLQRRPRAKSGTWKIRRKKSLRLMTEGSMFLHVLYHDIYPKLWNLHLKLFTLCLTSALLKYAISRLLYCIKAEPVHIHYFALREFLCAVFFPSKGQLISEANFKVYIWAKTELKYFCNSALAL